MGDRERGISQQRTRPDALPDRAWQGRAIANPIGRYRVFANSPVTEATAGPAPPANAVTAANCAAPAHTSSDITIAAGPPMNGPASTPKLRPMPTVGTAIAAEARNPAARPSATGDSSRA